MKIYKKTVLGLLLTCSVPAIATANTCTTICQIIGWLVGGVCLVGDIVITLVCIRWGDIIGINDGQCIEWGLETLETCSEWQQIAQEECIEYFCE